MLDLTPEPSAANLLFLEVDRRLGSTRNLPLDQLVALLGTQLVLRPHPLVALAIAAIMEAHPNQSSTASPITSDICETTCESGEPSPADLDRMAEVLHDTVYRMGARWAELHGDRRAEWREAMRAALRARRPNEAAVEASAWAELKRGQEVG